MNCSDKGAPVPAPPGAAPVRTDRGSSFVEIVVSITLLSVLVIPVMRSVIVSIKASTTATAASEVETALLNAVDRVNRSPIDRCDYTQFAEAAMLTQGWSATDVVVDHFYLDTTLPVPDWAQGPAGAAACRSGVHTDDLIQKVSVTVTDPQNKVTRTIEVVKSDV